MMIHWTALVPLAAEVRADALRAKAFAELNKIQALRFVAHHRRSLTQVQIKTVLGVSQPEVHRMIRRLDAKPTVLERTPREIITLRFLNRLTDDEMFAELAAWPFTFGSVPDHGGPEPEEYFRGSFDDVAEALQEGLITTGDYERIQREAGHQETE